MTRTMLTVITLLVGCATGAVMRDVVAPARAQGQAGPNYEYDAVAVVVNTRKEVLAKYGREGWRLVTATHATGVVGDHDVLYLERQAPAH